MSRKWFGYIMIVIAIGLAVCGIVLPREYLQGIIIVTNFFDIMIPVLAVTALINYIWKSNCCQK